jgi:hypothetical protein
MSQQSVSLASKFSKCARAIVESAAGILDTADDMVFLLSFYVFDNGL